MKLTHSAIIYTFVAIALGIAFTVDAGPSSNSVAPSQNMTDYSCLNAEISAYKTAASAITRDQAELALAQARAYASLYALGQSC